MFSANGRDSFRYIISLFSLVAVLSALVPLTAFANSTFNFVTLNGASTVTVAGGSQVTFSIRVTTDGSGANDDWRSTRWSLERNNDGDNDTDAGACVNTPDHDGDGTYTEGFTATMPSTAGSYDLEVIVYSGASCNSAQGSMSRSNAVTITAGDTTAPTVTGLSNDATPRMTKTWNWGANETATFRYVVDQNAAGTAGSGAYGSTVTASQNSGNGTYYIHVQAKDTAGNESAVVTVSAILDNTAPGVTGLTNDTTPKKTKTWNWGANESSTFRYIIDQIPGGSPVSGYNGTVTASQNSGNGTYYIHVQAKDTAGNTSTIATVSAILDNTAPVITIAGANPLALGTNNSYTDPGATALDAIDGVTTVVVADSVQIGIPGSYTILYSSTDTAGNTATAQRTVNVSDDDAPIISGVPSNIVVEATSPSGAVATFTLPTALDNVNGSVPVVCNQTSGATFPIGVTSVGCTASDAVPNTASASFTITVEDTTAPAIEVTPENQSGNTIDENGMSFGYSFSASDIADSSVVVDCTPVASGGLFPIGVTTITCTATDDAGNSASDTAVVTVTLNDNIGGGTDTSPFQETSGSTDTAPIDSGEVLGTSTTTEAAKEAAEEETEEETEEVSCTLLTHYIGSGKNSVEDVVFLQEFLNKEMSSKLLVDGVFSKETRAVVKQFQLKYWEEILLPWAKFGLGKKESTGVVYKTTQRMINKISCPGMDIPMPKLP